MTDETNQTPPKAPADTEPQLTQEQLDARTDGGPSRKDLLLLKAESLGVKHSPNIGEDTLAAKIQEHMDSLKADEDAKEKLPKPPVVTQTEQPVDTARASNRPVKMSKAEMLEVDPEDIQDYPKAIRTQILREQQRHEGLRLIRVQIYNNNPSKNDLKGEILSISNKYLGVVKKFIPFGEATDAGYHVPKVLLDMIKARKYQRVKTVKNADGTERVEATLAPEYTINELPPLTPAELKELAASQQARNASVGFIGA